ncbi:MAG: hypothetical protein R3C26_20855 [Calditrichia bacterium]
MPANDTPDCAKSVEKLEFVGMEYVRTDWTPLAKDFQYQLYWRVLKECRSPMAAGIFARFTKRKKMSY